VSQFTGDAGCRMTKRQVVAEVLLVFAFFAVQGARPVPNANEPHYLGKAIHYWNPGWAGDDFFFQSADAHAVFYLTYGWLAYWLPPTLFAWSGRLLTWALLAWAWQRLSFAAVSKRWFSVLTAGMLCLLIKHCHVAGEWIIGGFEAKGFAFVLLFLGLEALVRGRWKRVWPLLGAAASFHVLVGGWAVVAAGLAWLGLGKDRSPLRSTWPAILAGFCLSLPGLIPALLLSWGAGPDLARAASRIYVYEILPYHLIPAQFFGGRFVLRFAFLLGAWLLLYRATPAHNGLRRLRAFVNGAIAIALLGLALSFLQYVDRDLAASLLRFFWFRLFDVAITLGIALSAAAWIVWALRAQPLPGRRGLAAAVLVVSVHVTICAVRDCIPTSPRADRLPDSAAWRQACGWVLESGAVPENARFLTPRMSQTFKWYARRSEVATWEDIPEDARSIVQWWQRLEDLYGTGSDDPQQRWHDSLAQVGAVRLQQLGAKYRADYAITRTEPRLPLEVMYENRSYVIYSLECRPPSAIVASQGGQSLYR